MPSSSRRPHREGGNRSPKKHKPRALKTSARPRDSITSNNHHRIEDDLPTLHTSSYYIRHIANSIEQNAPSFLSRLTPHQKQFLRREILTHPHEIDSKHELLRFVNKCVKIFDRAFFWGELERRIWRVIVYTRNDQQGTTTSGFYVKLIHALCINLDNPDEDGETVLTSDYAAVVVHEMLHGFLNHFACSCAFCIGKRKYRHGRSGTPGSEHGPLFLNALRAIEEAMQDEYCSEFDTRIFVSLRLEMLKTGWQPRSDQFERWGLEYFELDDEGVWEDGEEDDAINYGGYFGGRVCICNMM